MFFDTHAHFEQRDGEHGYAAAVRRAGEAGVDRILAVGSSQTMNEVALAAAGDFGGTVYAAIGFDRDTVRDAAWDGEGAALVSGLRARIEEAGRQAQRVVAVGEIGLDFHYGAGTAGEQVRLLGAQLGLARELGLPVVVHSREAEPETREALLAHVAAGGSAAGVLHCFTGGRDFAESLMDLGFSVSFSGILTFRNAGALREVARDLPAERILIETDTPYLAPAPHRGRRNEPAFVRYVAEALAELRGCSVRDIAETTRRNAERLFGL